MDNIRVAVYGTLRKDCGNDYLLKDSVFLGQFRTDPKYTMYDAGCPFVSRGGQDSITVEVYAVDQYTLKNLDRLEHYPSLYNRIQIPTPWGDAWMYVMEDFFLAGADYVASGDWKSITGLSGFEL